MKSLHALLLSVPPSRSNPVRPTAHLLSSVVRRASSHAAQLLLPRRAFRLSLVKTERRLASASCAWLPVPKPSDFTPLSFNRPLAPTTSAPIARAHRLTGVRRRSSSSLRHHLLHHLRRTQRLPRGAPRPARLASPSIAFPPLSCSWRGSRHTLRSSRGADGWG